ncbi:cytochrome C oxidase subunit IV family protein [Acidobacteria bacterium AH-259-A15]|nr:cytochrome C oxidase subunit IV family protein [Acidobacteria bacterium AH-259-A15]
MSKNLPTIGYAVYWRIWFLLLILTAIMVFVDQVSLPRLALVWILVLAMLMKASLIAGYFMHLRFEKLTLAVIVGVGILATAAALFLLIAPDGIRILKLSSG